MYSPEIIFNRFGVLLEMMIPEQYCMIVNEDPSLDPSFSISMPQNYNVPMSRQEFLSYLQTLAPWVTWQCAEALSRDPCNVVNPMANHLQFFKQLVLTIKIY